MFTGIVQCVGVVDGLEGGAEERLSGGVRAEIAADELPGGELELGESIAVEGVCLTVSDLPRPRVFACDLSEETLNGTTLGSLAHGRRVNLERSATPATLLGGHLVSGHVDGVGHVLSRAPAAGSERWRFEVPAELARYVAVKGSITVDGVSLTVNAVEGVTFEVNLIPHTLNVTTLDERQAGDPVNIEVDRIARYVERLMEAGR